MVAGPVRTCVACRRRRRQEELLRVARRPQGAVVPDVPGERAEGRGAYVCPVRDCVERAVRSGRLIQALRLPGTAPAAVERELETALQRR
ncbi:YlxR family protein [soil metagenome]